MPFSITISEDAERQLRSLTAREPRILEAAADTGETVVVEMPDQRLLAIQPLEPQEDDNLIDELLASDAKFQALVAKSKASPRKPFKAGGAGPADDGASA